MSFDHSYVLNPIEHFRRENGAKPKNYIKIVANYKFYRQFDE